MTVEGTVAVRCTLYQTLHRYTAKEVKVGPLLCMNLRSLEKGREGLEGAKEVEVATSVVNQATTRGTVIIENVESSIPHN